MIYKHKPIKKQRKTEQRQKFTDPQYKKFFRVNKIKVSQTTYEVQKIFSTKSTGCVVQLKSPENKFLIGKMFSLGKQRQAITQIYYLNLLKGQHICNLIDINKSDKGIILVIQKGWKTLNQFQYSHNNIESILKNIAIAYQFFYKHNTAHRDLKFQNIVIQQDLKIKFIDLELCQKNDQLYGTVGYISPQFMALRWYNTDLYAYGTIAKDMVQNLGYDNKRLNQLIEGCLAVDGSRWKWQQVFSFWQISKN